MAGIIEKIQPLKKKRQAPLDEQYEFLPSYLEVVEKPASPLAKTSALAISSLLIAALVWSIVGKLDIFASASGQVIVSSRSKVIEPFVQGEVEEILVKEGDRVHQGDVLIKLNPIGAEAERARIASQIDFTLLEISRYQVLLGDELPTLWLDPNVGSEELLNASRMAIQSDWQERQAQLEGISAELDVNLANQLAVRNELSSLALLRNNVEERLDARKILMESKSIARMEVLDLEKELLDTQRAVFQQQSQLKVLQAEEKKLKDSRTTYLAGLKKDYHHRLNELQGQYEGLAQELVKANNAIRQQVLLAPVNGTVQQLQVNTLGGVVQPAEELMVIVPEDALLEVEAKLLNKDVGFVIPGQTVEVKIDTFPYTKYGTVPADVVHVSRDAVKDEQFGMVFPVRIRLQKDNIKVEENLVPLQPGMTVVAEIKTGQRRVIEYLLSPLQQYQSEAMRER
ncbi:HlyD family type I secretion periplasmic adaptor subunit [Vibrio parahaemolyticus]|uniref:HlyD family type I secretion periplasmic adaptor subunit n=1 Tax=Vibrio vulnificus TaxID=672 RepID=UPI0002ECDA9C|nr:HlyD family type I secretion periplasmic adaptor subunit [Vibrio vulnificus]MBM5032074.1 HlyD family type I secretion periplasmic adaptor subunit [Vibrio parahaemolyticus]MCG6261856.1 HlyD family type I secretion periplasmic adaptor subunit [Vibrio vulnificus]MCU8505094.1 HlyD family type I secretion periplasmic adaptor subunit [Vibrio vulnificus]MDF4803237.1 HlyD family type I secretion periplasmic adaptor subunit [Vibrio parahaemolyticus]MDF4809520.1 HlyD family type I secretion periplasm